MPELNASFLRTKFEAGLDWNAYLERSPSHVEAWRRSYEAVSLSPTQRALIASFTRTMNVLCLSGMWCGDCSVQVPMLQRISESNPRIKLRFLDRDDHLDLSDSVRICGGRRVPTTLFLAEDFEFCSLLGDRTLHRYRAIAARSLAASCDLPSAPAADSANTLQDWIDEHERVALMLRLSPRLRQMHHD
ncbi:MAG: thioredoxin family protein [Phycisphaerales bacterium]|nr:thioredoxin family protein [Phycisphaerales bacterium]